MLLIAHYRMPTFPSTNAFAPEQEQKEQKEQKKPRNTKKSKKNDTLANAMSANSTLSVADSNVCIMEEPVDDETNADFSIENTEEDEVTSEPTFPDIVILKQTDKNYIVKHNHYHPSIHDKNGGDEMPNTIKNKMNTVTHATINNTMETSDLVSPNQIYKGQINKKRGRKPKAGFILNSNSSIYDTSEVPNIILHLKCHLSDLKSNDSISNYDYTPSISEVESYNLSSNNLQSSDICQTYSPERDNDDDDKPTMHQHNMYQPKSLALPLSLSEHTSNPKYEPACDTTTGTAAVAVAAAPVKKVATDASVHVLNERYQKEIMKKINRLKYSFHNGETIQMKLNHKCSCFWDTCEFDGPIYYMPIMIVNGVFHVSGCFCSPECALAAILKEQLDTSTKFERIHLLHLLYGSTNNKGFKPAPNPNYLLDRYYGNLTIDEYRSLLKGTQMIHIVNKPLTHILPELYEDNNDFLVNSKVIPTNNLKLKKRYKTMVVQSSGGGGGGD